MEANNLPWKGVDYISETRHNEHLNLFEAKYRMGRYEDDVLIRKGKEINRASYDLLINFRHNNAIRMLNFYYDEENEEKTGCIVIPKIIDSPFLVWFHTEGGRHLLFDNAVCLTNIFRNMIIGLCDVIEDLHNNRIYLECLMKDDLYIKQTPGGPRLFFLPTQVKRSENPPKVDGERNKFVKALIDWCCGECAVELNFEARCFVDFVVSEWFTVEKLKSYPDNWDFKMKANYLLLLLSQVKQTTVRNYIRKAGIKWPKKFLEPDSPNNWPDKVPELQDLPDLLATMVMHETKRTYKLEDPYDYIRILRDAYIHFVALPDSVKETLKHEGGLINKIELWTPYLWTSLYAMSGPL